MPLMLLPFLPLTTVIMGMIVITNVKFTTFECGDLVKDTLDCDACWCYETGGGVGCCCCTVCHDHEDDHEDDDDDDPNLYYDDSSDSFHAHVYAKKS